MEAIKGDDPLAKPREFELSHDQLSYISTLLPKGFSFHAFLKPKKEIKDVKEIRELPPRLKDFRPLS